LVFSLLASAAFGGTFGTVVVLGGQTSDLALDEARGLVYVANYTANRIDVVSTSTLRRVTTIAMPAGPGSIALSPDGKYLVATHLMNFDPKVATPDNGLSVITLSGGAGALQTQIQTFSFGSPPLGVAFGKDGLALVVTATEFDLLDPVRGYILTLTSIDGVGTLTLPVPIGNYPADITQASMAVSGDGNWIFGTLGAGSSLNQSLDFYYDVAAQQLNAMGWISSPPMGPRAVSVDQTGTVYMSGWTLNRASDFVELAQFPNAVGTFSLGSNAIDSARGTIYGQVAMSSAFQMWPPLPTPYLGPVLMVTGSDNLAVREQLKLAENLSGKSVLSSDRNTMYSVSASGLTVMPVGQLYVTQGAKINQVAADKPQLLITSNWCNRTVQSQVFAVIDPGGAKTDFSLSTNMPGVTLTPSSGTTPAVITVSVDPTAYQNAKGTTQGLIQIQSALAVNVPIPVQLLINNPEPEQRGAVFSVPGLLVSVLADPTRNRFYILRQDTDQVLVFDASNYMQIATLRTPNTPFSMDMTFDKHYLIVGGDNSQVASLFDLNTLQFVRYLPLPYGHYPRWVAASGNAILAACRVAGPVHTIDRIQMWGMSTEYPTLGPWKNDIDIDTALVASSSGNFILGAMADGRTLLYDANQDAFVSARKGDFTGLTGAIAVPTDDTFIVGANVLDGSLVPLGTLSESGVSSGFAMAGGLGLLTAAPNSASPGVVSRVDLSLLPFVVRPTAMTEAPLLASVMTSAFTRTLAALANGNAIISLSTSGFVSLASNYDVAMATPNITSVVSAADLKSPVAPGGLMSVLGTNLSLTNAASSTLPLPTALANSCLTVNGVLVPMIMVSPTMINGQLPFTVSGTGTMILRTPAGVSNTFSFPIYGTAPSAFLVNVAGWNTLMPTVTHAADGAVVTPSYPIHLDEWLVIYVTGMGVTAPAVDSGAASPLDPLAQPLVAPTVILDGAQLPVDFAGLVPGEVGVYQINVKVPFKGVRTGMQIPLTITQGSYTATLSVRVVTNN
jgi:uncharacterized protein (TIGR03437 family)